MRTLLIICIVATAIAGCKKSKKENQSNTKSASNTIVLSGTTIELHNSITAIPKSEVGKRMEGKKISLNGRISGKSNFGNAGVKLMFKCGKKGFIHLKFKDMGKELDAKGAGAGSIVELKRCEFKKMSKSRFAGKKTVDIDLSSCVLHRVIKK